MLLSVFKLPVVEISPDHRGPVAVGRVLLPLAIVVVSICPGVYALPVFFSFFELALVFISVEVLHDSLAVVLPLSELSGVCAVAFLDVGALPVELSVLPLAFVPVSVFVLDLSLAAFDSFVPLAFVYSVRGLLDALAVAKALFEMSVIYAFSDHAALALAWIFLFFHFHLDPLSVFVVILEVSDVDDVLGVSEFALAVVLPLEEGALIEEAIFFVAAE